MSWRVALFKKEQEDTEFADWSLDDSKSLSELAVKSDPWGSQPYKVYALDRESLVRFARILKRKLRFPPEARYACDFLAPRWFLLVAGKWRECDSSGAIEEGR